MKPPCPMVAESAPSSVEICGPVIDVCPAAPPAAFKGDPPNPWLLSAPAWDVLPNELLNPDVGDVDRIVPELLPYCVPWVVPPRFVLLLPPNKLWADAV